VRIAESRLKDGDHINAWGTLQDKGFLLNPTGVVQDTNIGDIDRSHPTVSGILVARPVSGEANIPTVCQDRDQAAIARAVSENRGLVICTVEGRLVLLQLSPSTKIHARFWGLIALGRLTDGDHINAWGTLQDNGFLLDPTSNVQDTDVQEAYVNSQDFIAQGGPNLTLYVLESDANGPVQGIVHAVPGGVPYIVLCGGVKGTWQNLTQGKTINISNSLFNRRTMTYIRTSNVHVVSCP
jgi:hypothetical protein